MNESADGTNGSMPPARNGSGQPPPRGTGAAAQALKAAPALLVSALDVVLQISRAAQRLYDDAVDGALGATRAPGAASAAPVSNGSPAAGTQTDTALMEMVRDTLSGLIAFVVPGPDAYSLAQGQSTSEPGGLAAGVLPLLIETLNRTQPATPGGPPASVFVAGALNQIAEQVNGQARGGFVSSFASLSFAEKARVFAAIEANPQMRPLASVLPLTAFLVYSEAAVLDPITRTLRGQPLGWALSGYEGTADGRADFKGYWQDRTSVKTSAAFAWRGDH